MSILLEELIMEILLWLPVKSLVRFQSVSKSWHALINDPNFIKMHLQHSTETVSERILIVEHYLLEAFWLVNLTREGQFDEPIKVFQSSSKPRWMQLIGNPCNGLFCTRNHENRIVIWNPSIRKHKMIPPVQLDDFDFHKGVLGYDPVNNDYKVVYIVPFSELEEPGVPSDVLVYSMKENSWRKVKDELPFWDSFIFWSATYLNGNIHWLVEIQTEEIPNNQIVILALDLTSEKFQVHPFPVEPQLMPRLNVLGGKLCACTDHSLWMMKEYGVVSSWSLLCTLCEDFFWCNPLMISEDGQEILIKKPPKKYFWYNREKKTQKTTKVLHIPEFHWAKPSQGSLMLIDGDNDNWI